uniref:Uncharacterized protein n=1 Tax=Methanococcus maripaludis (strain C6 / ATCC BAA-1332) TaxID=444158 RepID=A9A7H1_METM6
MRVNVGVYHGPELLEILSFDTCGLAGEPGDRYTKYTINVIDDMLPALAKKHKLRASDLIVKKLPNEFNGVRIRPWRPKIVKK